MYAELPRLAQANESRGTSELELLPLSGAPFPVRWMATLLAQAEPLISIKVKELSPRPIDVHVAAASRSGSTSRQS